MKKTAAKKKPVSPGKSGRSAENGGPVEARVSALLTELQKLGSAQRAAEMGPRFGIHTAGAFGVAMADIQALARRTGSDHTLAGALWKTGQYEARMLAALTGVPAEVTPEQMDAWCADFDNWATCDTVCFRLFDRTPHAFAKVEQWARSEKEFVRRAAFALLASLALHDKKAPAERFSGLLPLIQAVSTDDRNFVKKAVNWALRATGERDAGLHRAALEVAERLAASPSAAARWIGSDARRQLQRAAVLRRVAKKTR